MPNRALVAVIFISFAVVGAFIAALVIQSKPPPSPPSANPTSSSHSTASGSPSSPSSAPSTQSWCTSGIFCPGPLLQAVSFAKRNADQKIFVDQPTRKSSQAVLDDFRNLSSASVGGIAILLKSDFAPEGQELEFLAAPPSDYSDSPPFLNNTVSPLVRAFTQEVHKFWLQLLRAPNASALCNGQCESTFIPLNHNLVLPAGSFREHYYWDTFWIVEGLLQSRLYTVVNGILQNFMDELELFGFIPNGGRTYYLNRSQPPLFIQMLSNYVQASQDMSILARALPLAEKELQWWNTSRSILIRSPYSSLNFTMYHYNVTNSAPRPESYFTDYEMANNLSPSQKADLYAELASVSETGWDLSSRWFAGGSGAKGLLGLNVRNIVGPDLNSIIYKNHLAMATLYNYSNAAAQKFHTDAASALRAGILDLLWDSKKLAFYDYIINTKSRSDIFSVAAFYPIWGGIIPNLVSPVGAFSAFGSVNMVLNRYNGTVPATFVESGFKWDAPNAWPPHQYIILQALRNLPLNYTNSSTIKPSNADLSTFSLIQPGQLNLDVSQLPGQPIRGADSSNVGNASKLNTPADDINALNGTVIYGGTSNIREDWSQTMQRELANRYFASVLCSWHATGGSIPNLLTRWNGSQNDGNIFEKFSYSNVDSFGEKYTKQVGFGWTNGVLLWVASTYGAVLVDPICPVLKAP